MSNILERYNHLVHSLEKLAPLPCNETAENVIDGACTLTLSRSVYDAAQSFENMARKIKVDLIRGSASKELAAQIEDLYRQVITEKELQKKWAQLGADKPGNKEAFLHLEKEVARQLEHLHHQLEESREPHKLNLLPLITEKDLSEILAYLENNLTNLLEKVKKAEGGLYLTRKETGLSRAVEISNIDGIKTGEPLQNLLLIIHLKKKRKDKTKGPPVGEGSFKVGKLSFGLSLPSQKRGDFVQLVGKEKIVDQAKMQREIGFLKELNGEEGIVPILSYSTHPIKGREDKMQLAFVIPLYDSDLQAFVKNRSVPREECVKIAKATIKGLRACHKAKIVHKDVKLSNYLFKKRGEEYVCDLADFGLSFKLKEHIPHAEGTTRTSSPETHYARRLNKQYEEGIAKKNPKQSTENHRLLLAALSEIGTASDIFSWGIEMWRLSHDGHAPDWCDGLKDANLNELIKQWYIAEREINDPFEQLLHNAMHPNPHQRLDAETIDEQLAFFSL